MAYVIGSQKGKDIAEKMKAGESWTNPADGSTWKKQSDGSVAVTTSKGETFNNAYTGGGNANSPYTQGNYSIGSSYGNKQAQNLGVNNEWIATDGSRWVKENDGTITVYHGGTQTKNAWQPTDLSIALSQLMQAGAPVENVEKMNYDRVNKALKDDSLRQYAYDDTYWQAYNYVQDHKTKENQDQYNQWLEDYLKANPKQEYQSQYDPQIDKLLNQILTRDDFSYDAMSDPLYQQYANMYRREGDRAMKETMAEAAAGAGGMNTYAITAAQQANSYYNSQLNDKIPQLYQLAYDMYLNDKESMVQDLGLLQNMDDRQYDRYRDTMNDWYNDKNFAYGMYQDSVNQGNWQKQFDYNANMDRIGFENDNYWANKEWNANDAWKNKEWNANQAELEYNKTQYNRETAEARANELIGFGEMPSDDLIAQAGLDKSYVLQLVNATRRKLGLPPISSGSSGSVTYTAGSGGSTGGGSKSNGYTGGVSPAKPASGTQTSQITSGLGDLGLGRVYDPSIVAQIARAGGVYEDKDGKLKWSSGWNANNFQEKLTKSTKTPIVPWGI